jgi:hypothetical protein
LPRYCRAHAEHDQTERRSAGEISRTLKREIVGGVRGPSTIDILVNAMVTGCDASGVSIGAARIETRTIVWGAGVRASAAGKWLGVETDRVGRALEPRPHLFS